MHSNSFEFFNFQSIENQSIFLPYSVEYRPLFKVNFVLPTKQKLLVLQTFELLYQFFTIRPSVKSIKKKFGGNYKSFTLFLTLRMYYLHKVFLLFFRIRNSSKFKLIKFILTDHGTFFIKLNDFTTLYPYKIRSSYDFYTWRNQVVITDSQFSSAVVIEESYEMYLMTNFFYSFFAKTRVRRRW